jgi:hypothetical protein
MASWHLPVSKARLRSQNQSLDPQGFALAEQDLWAHLQCDYNCPHFRRLLPLCLRCNHREGTYSFGLAIDEQRQLAVRTAIGKFDDQILPTAAQSAEIRTALVEADQLEHAPHEPGRLSQGHPEQDFHTFWLTHGFQTMNPSSDLYNKACVPGPVASLSILVWTLIYRTSMSPAIGPVQFPKRLTEIPTGLEYVFAHSTRPDHAEVARFSDKISTRNPFQKMTTITINQRITRHTSCKPDAIRKPQSTRGPR